ncbi:MAG: FAD-dependent monooxygenase [Pseudomonadota bacterium]
MSRRAAIAGAGIGGLAAGLALARAGWAVEIHERAAGLEDVGAGIQLGPNGVWALRALGVAEAAAGHAAVPVAVEMRDGRTGRLAARVPLGALAETRYAAPYWQMHRADLVGVLARAVETAGARLHFGSAIDPAAPPSADLVVAADGVRSGFRAAICPDAAPRFTGQVAWRMLIPADRAPAGLDPERTQLLMGPGGHAVLYPLRGGQVWNLVAARAQRQWAAEGWQHDADPEDVARAFAGWAAPMPDLIAALDRVILWGLFAHGPLPRWSAGRSVLLGDACHPMLPFMAQGAAMALEDAVTLAACLDDPSRPVPAALAAYEAARKPRTTRVQRVAAGNARLYHLRPAPVRRAVHLGMGAVSAMSAIGLLRRFDWLYGFDVGAKSSTGLPTPAP